MEIKELKELTMEVLELLEKMEKPNVDDDEKIKKEKIDSTVNYLTQRKELTPNYILKMSADIIGENLANKNSLEEALVELEVLTKHIPLLVGRLFESKDKVDEW